MNSSSVVNEKSAAYEVILRKLEDNTVLDQIELLLKKSSEKKHFLSDQLETLQKTLIVT